MAVLGDQYAYHAFAKVRVGYADDSTFQHAVLIIEQQFNLFGVDVVTA